MALVDTVVKCRSGVVQIGFGNEARERVGGGSAFLCNDYLVTNHHVFLGHSKSSLVQLRRDDMPIGTHVEFRSPDFAAKLVTGSQEQSYDYAVLDIPELIDRASHQFSLESPVDRRIGEQIALLGFPLEHSNLTCHAGIVSSFYTSGIASIIQLDASVNSGNSGGPLIDPETGTVLGLITRKATGLSQLFGHLRGAIQQNLAVAQAAGGGIAIGGIDVVQAFIASQHQMLLTMDEIERQANVGIGYAISAEHLLAESCLSS